MYINNQWQPTQQVTDIFLAVPSSLTSEMLRIRNLYRFMYRQYVYHLEKRRGDCLMKWLIMLGFMDLRGPRVCRRSTPVLLYPRNEVRGGILDSACLSVRLSVCLSVCPLTFSCPPCSIYSSGWILSIFGTNDQYHERVCRMWWPFFWQIFEIFWPWPWKKKSSVLNWFYPYLAQMITSKRRCVAYNDLWPWPISSRSFGLGLENRVRSVASTVLDGFFPYLIQMITSMRRCVACDDLWPWPISSRSFGLHLENRVRFVASTVLDGFFSYVAQMIAINRGCVACYVFFRIRKFEFLANFWNFSALTLKKKIFSSQLILSISSTNDH